MNTDLEFFKQQALWYLANLKSTPDYLLRPSSDYLPCIELKDDRGISGSWREPHSVEFQLDGTTYAYAKHWRKWRKLRSTP